MIRDLFWMGAKVLAAIGAAYSGYLAGFAASYYLGDHGDVGSAFIGTALTIPAGIVIGALLGWFAVRRFEPRNEEVAPEPEGQRRHRAERYAVWKLRQDK